MFKKTTREYITKRDWLKHSNPSTFLKRMRDECKEAIDDLTLVANTFDDDQLQQIFNAESMESFVQSLVRPHLARKGYKYTEEEKDRIFGLCYVFLKWSLNMTKVVSGNMWFDKFYETHELPLRDMLEAMYHEKKRARILSTRK